MAVQLKVLQQPASRLLISALMLFASTYSRPLMLCVIVPIIACESCNAFQADVVMKLVKTVFNPDHYSELLGSVLDVCTGQEPMGRAQLGQK